MVESKIAWIDCHGRNVMNAVAAGQPPFITHLRVSPSDLGSSAAAGAAKLIPHIAPFRGAGWWRARKTRIIEVEDRCLMM